MDPRLAEERRKKRLQNQQKREKQILDLAGLEKPPKLDYPSSCSPTSNTTDNNNPAKINNNYKFESEEQVKKENLEDASNESTNNISEKKESTNLKHQTDQKSVEKTLSPKDAVISKHYSIYILYFISFILGLLSIKYGLLIFYASCFVFGLLIPLLISFWCVKFTLTLEFYPLLIADILSFGKCFPLAYFCLIISRVIFLFIYQ